VATFSGLGKRVAAREAEVAAEAIDGCLLSLIRHQAPTGSQGTTDDLAAGAAQVR
jgi:hypothetical protein